MEQQQTIPQQIMFWMTLAVVFLFFMFPLYWILLTSFKERVDIITVKPSYVPYVEFQPTLDNYREVLSGEDNEFRGRLINSIIITGGSTILAVFVGTLTAYAVSRFTIPLEDDFMFFVLSTKMLPPIVVLIPIVALFSELGLRDSYFGLIILYTAFNLPFVVWIMKGFFDEIPKEYEDAAMVDGYSRLQAIYKIVLPEAIPAMAATAVFSIIVSWNEFVLVNFLNRDAASTVPPYLNEIIGVGGVQWGPLAAASVIYVIPVIIFTFIVRNHLLRGVTFGAVRR